MKTAAILTSLLLITLTLYLGNVDIKSAANSAFANMFQNGGNSQKETLLETIDLNKEKGGPTTPKEIVKPKREERIIISEIMADPEGSDKGKEFIRLFNPNNFDVDLTGWTIKQGNMEQTSQEPSVTLIKFGSNDQTIIKANSFYLIGFNNYNIEPPAEAKRSKALPNSGAKIILINKEGEVIGESSYGKQ